LSRKKFDKERFKSELHKKIKPATTWWALIGIIFFFFVPEIIAFFWGEDLKVYFTNIAKTYHGTILEKLYMEVADMISENSLLNIAIGLGFVYWWYYERQKAFHEKEKYKDLL